MKYIKGTRIVDHTGCIYGDIKVLGYKGIQSKKHHTWYVNCICCGREFTMQSTHLKGKVKGMGCGTGCSARINKNVTHNEDGTTVVDISTKHFPNKFTIVDTEDYYKYMLKNKWYAYKAKHSNHFYCYSKQNGKRVSLHRVINQTPDTLLTDHISGNGLDNRKVNLRSVTESENQRNCTIPINNVSGYPGVFQVNSGRWAAVVARGVNEQERLGTYDSSEEALDARVKAETKYGYHENNGRSLVDEDVV